MIKSELTGKKIHIIGIGGTGMSSIGRVLLEMGAVVSGSDRSESIYTEELRKAGAKVIIGQKADNINHPDIVIYSSAIHPDNPELQSALEKGIPSEKRLTFLSTLLEGRDIIAISGTHGKTTTTSMAAWVLQQLQTGAGYIIGGISKNLGTNASAGTGSLFVIEADEYDHMFWGLSPKYAVVTRIEHDHPDCYPTKESYFDAFRTFLKKTIKGGTILLNADDPNQNDLTTDQYFQSGNVRVFHFGINNKADFSATDVKLDDKGCGEFTFTAGGVEPVRVHLSIPGEHNIYNALVVMVLCCLENLDLNKAAEALHQFSGDERRFDKIAEWNHIEIIDDYAHHPTEIKATLAAAKAAYAGRKIWALWQPHTFSRTKLLLNDFNQSFNDADAVIVTNIFAAREIQQDFGFEDLKKAFIHPNTYFAETNAEAVKILKENLQPGDVVITLSAGDANQIGPAALECMKEKK